MAWTREFDTTYQTHYWYDSKTGESSWTEPPGWSEPSVEAENRRPTDSPTRTTSSSWSTWGRGGASGRRTTRTMSRTRTWRCCPRPERTPRRARSTRRRRRPCASGGAASTSTRNFCEQYCAAAEALIRAPCYVVAGVLIFCCWPRWAIDIREGLLFARGVSRTYTVRGRVRRVWRP